MFNQKCRLSKEKLKKIMSFGKMPIANNFLQKNDFSKNEFFYDMEVYFSEKLSLFQLGNHPPITKMFNKNYAFISGTSKFMDQHFKETKNWIIKEKYLDLRKKNKVIEIGCNDGIFLKNFLSNDKVDVFGFEPSDNVAKIARNRGIKIYNKFFNFKNVNQHLNSVKNTDLIYAANAFCHIPNLIDIIKGIDLCLKENGYLIFEDPYLGSMLDKVSYDQIYDEHIFIFSILSVEKIFNLFNFTLVDAIPLETHGGSMRYVVKKQYKAKQSHRLVLLKDKELKNNLDDFSTYKKFKNNCELSKKRFRNNLLKIKNKKQKIFGYGATSKSTTILNYCEIGKDIIDYIVDTSPTKIWRYSPGMHIPILPYEIFKNNFPDIYVLFAWNHAKEIKNKEKLFSRKGKWITHLKN
jgi:SAM-dependent methyltransferase